MERSSHTFSNTSTSSDVNADLPPLLLLRAFWEARRLILSIALVFVFIGGTVFALSKPMYEATATIGPMQNADLGSKSPLSAVASLGLGGGDSSTNFGKFVQILTTTRLAKRLDQKYGIAKTMLGGWDPAKQDWKKPTGLVASIKDMLRPVLGRPPWSPPDANTLASVLAGRIGIQKVGASSILDMRNQITVVSLKMANRAEAITLLSRILRESDQLVRQDQLTNCVNRIRYLKDLIKNTHEVYLAQSLQQILANQEQTQMMLQADRVYAVDVIDPPHASHAPVSPKLATIMLGSVFLGLLLSFVLVFIIFRQRAAVAQREDDIFATPFPGMWSLAKMAAGRSLGEIAWRWQRGQEHWRARMGSNHRPSD